MVAAGCLRIVFFGTPSFAVPTLEGLLRSRHEVVAVVTQPDRPRGRGQKTSDSPVKARAGLASVIVLQPATLKDTSFVSTLAHLGADIGVVAAYGKILPETVINTPRLGMVNVHASLLPKYRGAAPVHRAVMAGEAETGVTIMRLVKALDAGPMLAKQSRPIGPDETSDDVERDLARIGADLLVKVLDRMAGEGVDETPQDEADATYASRLVKEEGAIDWSRPAGDLHNMIRGLHPWPHAFSYLGNQRVIFLRAAPPEGTAGADAAPPGSVTVADGQRLTIATGSGALEIVELQVEGKRRMTAREFLAGHRLSPGDRFSSPA
jgi:methionyl-tRNA formyltransferase